MLWYGSSKTPSLAKKLQNNSNRLNWKDRKFGHPLARNRFYPATFFTFQISAGWKFVILKSTLKNKNYNVFYAYNPIYFLNFSLISKKVPLYYDEQTRTVRFHKWISVPCYFAFLRTLTSLLTRLHKPFFLKIKFKGKGYYMYKNKRNTIAPQFGFAHRVYVYSFLSTVKFLSKTKILLFGLSKKDILNTGHNLRKVKPMNIFTGRGVRFARQVVYKKTGKVGAYR